MEVFIFLLIFSLTIFAALFAMLVWSVGDGQLDDLTTPAERVLWDDPTAVAPVASESSTLTTSPDRGLSRGGRS